MVALTLQQAYEKTVKSLTWTLEDAQLFLDSFDKSIQHSIELRRDGIPFDHEMNSLKCIDSFVDLKPSGNERGNYYAIDLGGTNLRAVCATMLGRGEIKTTQVEENIRTSHVTTDTPKGLLDKNTPASVMFDEIALLTKKLIKKMGDNPKGNHNIAFTFSFPVIQRSLNSGELICWTKEFETGQATNDPVEMQDVGDLLNAAFRRKGMGAHIGAVANDTVGTLLSAGYENNASWPVCHIGIILGTGFNIASYDPIAQQNGYSGSIINHECGNYSGVTDFRTIVDVELDFSTSDRGKQLSEKMISGAYLGELCRLTFLSVFKYRCAEGCWKLWGFQTPDAAEIYSDNTKGYKITQSVLREKLGWIVDDQVHLLIIFKLVCAVFDRSATVAALMATVYAHRTRNLQKALGGVTIGIDGSLYLKNSKYRKTFKRTIEKVLGDRSGLVHIVAADDGSGKGAAVISACLDKK